MLAACLGALCLLGLVPAAASADPSPGDADRASKAADRAEAILENATATARAAARRLEEATAQLPAAQDKVAKSKGVVAAASAQAVAAREKANAARAAYQKTAGAFTRAQDRVGAARQHVEEIAAASYMGGNFATINMLVEARGPQDAMDRLGLVDQVMRKQQEGIDDLVVARRQARTQQDRAGLARRAAEDAERDAADKLAAAKAAQEAAERAREAVEQLTASRREAFAVANSQKRAVLAKYEQARAEEARIQNALRGWDDRNGTVTTYSGGDLLMPVHGWKTSDFGTRYDPYYHVWQLHAGTDIAAPGGTLIRAAASGRVIRAGWAGGYGNYTCLSHGRGMSTCYGHQSAILVGTGDFVRRGEVIGKVGTTGASTGYHLHFEVRINGEPTNPLQYLPSCFC